MQNNIIWKGRNDESLENCNVLTNDEGFEVNSTVSITLDETICDIGYFIQTGKNWKSRYCKITSCEDENTKTLELRRLPENRWEINGKHDRAFDGCDAIDISITPFPNTLIINRKAMEQEESFEVKMIYIDAIKMECEPIDARYTKLTDREYEYENLTTGFNVVLDVDEEGFVVNYPGFFKKIV